ncbi:MAG: efflux RND transporter permease subunit [Pseudomonadota bacterium]
MKLIRLATRRRVTILMFTIAVMLFGLVSLTRLPLSLLPDLSYPTLTVRTDYSGAAPAEVETLITRPVEEALGVVRGVRLVHSISRPGQSDVTLEFVWGSDMDLAALDVRERLETLNLPLAAERPLLLRFDPSTEPVLRFALSRKDVSDLPENEPVGQTILPDISANDSVAELRILRRYADEQLVKSMESIGGVAAITVSGGLEDEIQVVVDQYRLAQLQLSIEQVIERLRASNINLSGGRLEEGARQFLVRTINEYETVQQIDDTIIATQDGRPIYLSDIAEVRESWREREAITRVNGAETVELAIYREGDANVVSVAREVERNLNRVRSELPADLQLVSIYDQSIFIRNAILQVIQAALLGGLLAIAVLYVFLRNAKSTVIIAMAIPVSVMATFAAMYGGGLSLNIMSLGGIALAIGLLVDNAIVVLENIARKREQGMSTLDAARSGASEVSSAVVASTLTTIAVFLPLAFVDGIAGQLFRDQALTVTFALLVSLFVALTLIPMLASLGQKAGQIKRTSDAAPAGEDYSHLTAEYQAKTRIGGFVHRTRVGVINTVAVFFTRITGFVVMLIGALVRKLLFPLVWLVNIIYGRIERVYPSLLEAALKQRALVLILALGLFAGSVALVPRLGMDLVPSLAQGEFNVEIVLAPGTPLERTDQVIAGVDEMIRQHPAVARTYVVAGTGSRLDTNPEEAGEYSGTLNVVLNAGSDAEADVIAELRDHLQRMPGTTFSISRPELFSFSTPLVVEVAGFDLDELKRVSDRIAERMAVSDRFADIESSMTTGHPELQIRFDHERAAQLGLRADQIANTIVRQVDGEVATRFSSLDRRIDVLVRARDEQRQSAERIAKLVINPGAERPVTLDAVADIQMVIGPGEINRSSQQRVATLSTQPRYGDLGQAVAEVERIIAEIPMPTGVGVRVAGQSEEMQRSFKSLVMALALAIFLVYLVMASQFESLLHPFVILMTVPLALTGAILALWLTGSTISVVVFIGMIMLVGIVVNNAIVLVTRINQLREDGLKRHTAIVEAAKARLRPIVMTTLTTILGLLPLAIGLGEGAEMRAPMAITVIGGLLLATLLTLIVIPVFYSVLDRRRREVDAKDHAGLMPATEAG